jgi:hypothetical protein
MPVSLQEQGEREEVEELCKLALSQAETSRELTLAERVAAWKAVADIRIKQGRMDTAVPLLQHALEMLCKHCMQPTTQHADLSVILAEVRAACLLNIIETYQ